MSLTEQTGAEKLAAEQAGVEIGEPMLLAETKLAGTVEVIPLALLKVDHAYQRDLSMELVQKIARDYDIVAADLIVVSRRSSGDLYVVNGQHRAAAAQLAGEVEILAHVVPGLTPPEEAELRLKGNTRRTDNVFERFRAQRAAGHAETIAIDAVAASFGTKMNSWADNAQGVNAISTIEWLYRRDNGMLLVRVFELIRDSFGSVGGNRTTNVAILKGLAFLIERHPPNEVNRDRLVERLQHEGADELGRRARSHQANLGGARWMNVYRAAIEIYNEGLPEPRRVNWRTGGWAKDFGRQSKESAESRGLEKLPS